MTGFIATTIDPENPAAWEFFHALITERQLMDVIDLLLEAPGGNLPELLANQATRLNKSQEARELLRQYPVDRHNPKSALMQARARAVESFIKILISLISSRSATDAVTPSVTSKSPKKVAKVAGPDSMYSTMAPLASIKPKFRKLRQMLAAHSFAALNHSPAPQTVPARSADSLAALAPSYDCERYDAAGEAQLADIRNHLASQPGQHGVQFETSGQASTARGRTTAPSAAAPTTTSAVPGPAAPAAVSRRPSSVSSPPPPSSRKAVVREYIRRQQLCYKHAIQGDCQDSQYKWNHPLPVGFYRENFPPNVYRDSSRQQRPPRLQGPRERVVLAAMTADDFDEAVQQGMVLQGGSPDDKDSESGESVLRDVDN